VREGIVLGMVFMMLNSMEGKMSNTSNSLSSRLTHHKDLDVWKKSMDLVLEIYKKTESFPNHELYGLTSQIRRSAVSIPSNIAEGAGRKSRIDFIRFCYIAMGSVCELETQYILSIRLGYIDNQSKLQTQILDIKRLLNGLIRSLEKKNQENR
jgi:four helix bundle protein